MLVNETTLQICAVSQPLDQQTTPADDIAISVKNLTKKYRIFGHPGDRIKQALTFGRVRFHREFAALQDIFLRMLGNVKPSITNNHPWHDLHQ